jgi:hypothetical protein
VHGLLHHGRQIPWRGQAVRAQGRWHQMRHLRLAIHFQCATQPPTA